MIERIFGKPSVGPQRRLSIRSKFLIMMLLTSFLSLGAITFMAYRTGKQAISEAAANHLTSLREAKKQQVEYYFRAMRGAFRSFADAPDVVEALDAFSDGYRQLGKQPLAPERFKALEDYYSKNFMPELAQNSDDPVSLEDFLPPRPQARELQSIYIVENPNKPGEKGQFVRHPSDIPYARAHAQYHRWFAEMAQRLSFYDIFLINADGDVVYTVTKEPDLGRTIESGVVAGSNLGALARQVAASRQPGEAHFSDFAFYKPSLNAPAAFIAAPLFRGDKFVGVLAAQISIDEIGKFMNGGGDWREQGLGDTGALYLVGRDLLMRSNYRPLMERNEAFLAQVAEMKVVTPTVLQRMKLNNTSVLYYPARGGPVARGFQGQSGTESFVNQRGVEALLSYAPLDIPDLDWVVVARMDAKEILASQIAFARNVMIAACAIAILVTLAALWLAGLFLRPVTALTAGIERLRKGERGVTLASRSHDEFNDLISAFNTMSATIKDRDEVIEGKSRAYEQLLKSIFPEVVADRMRQGEAAIAETYPQVTVIYAVIEDFARVAAKEKAEDAIRLLNEIVDRFDAVADDNGVEKVKTVGDHYLAVSGLSVARLDSARRALEFCRRAFQELARVNREQGLSLGLRVGVATGAVQVGLVGSRRFVFDVWGEAASAARRISYEAEFNCVRINAVACQQLTDRDGIGEELVVPTKSLGPITTYQLHFDAGADAHAAE